MPLPTAAGNDWQEKRYAASGKTYFYNTKTKETTWKRPAGLPLAPSAVAADAPAAIVAAGDPLPENWAEKIDPKTQKVYYYNSATKETSWKRPAGAPQTATSDSALPPNWEQRKDERSGKQYFYNSKTKETSWKRPQAAAFAAAVADRLSPVAEADAAFSAARSTAEADSEAHNEGTTTFSHAVAADPQEVEEPTTAVEAPDAAPGVAGEEAEEQEAVEVPRPDDRRRGSNASAGSAPAPNTPPAHSPPRSRASSLVGGADDGTSSSPPPPPVASWMAEEAVASRAAGFEDAAPASHGPGASAPLASLAAPHVRSRAGSTASVAPSDAHCATPNAFGQQRRVEPHRTTPAVGTPAAPPLGPIVEEEGVPAALAALEQASLAASVAAAEARARRAAELEADRSRRVAAAVAAAKPPSASTLASSANHRGATGMNGGRPRGAPHRNAASTSEARLRSELGVSAVELSEYKEVFSSFDRDGDGTIDASELGRVLASLGLNLNATELDDMIHRVDTDGSGTIDFVEFCKLMTDRQSRQASDGGVVSGSGGSAGSRPDWDMEADIEHVFQIIDSDGDGYITLADLAATAETIAWGIGGAPSHEDLEAMLLVGGGRTRVDLLGFRQAIIGGA